uniref:Uncharacterized protein n=1 Tax=Glossina pallidipes TaxID=7398 RepID=A0A1A9ZQH6_GLOPL
MNLNNQFIKVTTRQLNEKYDISKKRDVINFSNSFVFTYSEISQLLNIKRQMLFSVFPTLTDVSTLLLMYNKATDHLKQDLEDLVVWGRVQDK